jgi:hypothetical protein
MAPQPGNASGRDLPRLNDSPGAAAGAARRLRRRGGERSESWPTGHLLPPLKTTTVEGRDPFI